MRLLLLVLVASLGFFASPAAVEPSRMLEVRVRERVVQKRGSTEEPAARAPLVRTPMRVVSRTGPTSPPPGAAGGSPVLVGDASVAVVPFAGLRLHSGVDPPRLGRRVWRGQPEGRGPPMGPSVA